jgi:hypothetical protein
MTTATTIEAKITGGDACVCMHTALRKACDSKITSAVYNLVHLVDVEPAKYDPWRFLGQLVADRLNEGEKPVEALKNAHAELEDKFLALVLPESWNKSHARERSRNDEPPAEARTWMYALSCAMHCFSKNDWNGMAAYLGDE